MLEEFLSLLCGRFNNAAQAAEQQALDPNFPLAAHCNTACNDKIAHLPAGFAGVFVVEEAPTPPTAKPMLRRICFFLPRKATASG